MCQKSIIRADSFSVLGLTIKRVSFFSDNILEKYILYGLNAEHKLNINWSGFQVFKNV